jgi:hypothetical protein
MIATVAVDVCTRPCVSVAGTRWTRWTPASYFILEKTESPFSVSGLLTQVLNLGTIAEYLNVDLKFDPAAKRFISNDEANARLAGPAPRAEWAGCYKLA